MFFGRHNFFLMGEFAAFWSFNQMFLGPNRTSRFEVKRNNRETFELIESAYFRIKKYFRCQTFFSLKYFCDVNQQWKWTEEFFTRMCYLIQSHVLFRFFILIAIMLIWLLCIPIGILIFSFINTLLY